MKAESLLGEEKLAGIILSCLLLLQLGGLTVTIVRTSLELLHHPVHSFEEFDIDFVVSSFKLANLTVVCINGYLILTTNLQQS